MVQMYHAHPDPTRWTKFKTGVVCFVKDNVRKSYYIRLLEMTREMNVSPVYFIMYTILYYIS